MYRQDPSEILQQCIQAIVQGTATIEQCVAQYPQFDGLEQLLQAVQTTRQAPHGTISVVSKRALERRLVARMKTQPSSPVRPRRIPLTFGTAAGAILAAMIVIMVLATSRISTPQIAA